MSNDHLKLLTKDDLITRWKMTPITVIQPYFNLRYRYSYREPESMQLLSNCTNVSAKIKYCFVTDDNRKHYNIEDEDTQIHSLCAQLKKNEDKNVKSILSDMNFIKKLFKGKDCKAPSLAEIKTGIQEKIRHGEGFEPLYIDHDILDVGIDIFIVDINGVDWTISKETLIESNYYPSFTSCRYLFDDAFYIEGEALNDIGAKGEIKTGTVNVFAFLKEQDAIDFYNLKVDGFMQNNPKVKSL